ncbi:MAG TPA: hypothetical protein VME19_19140 [Streptosporangiaceae bacterium]|nr:hypothetical protein [Streptosporangiaceae bacterium]
MRTEWRLPLRWITPDPDGAPRSGHRRGDVLAVVLLAVLPAIVFGVPALTGHPVLVGDDLTQNYPLRVLAGTDIRGGHLPLFDPYIWSGAPLLAGWNAGAAYPLTWLFAILPGTAAWTVNMIVTWAVAGLGMFCFLRALRLGSLASFLGALSFAFAGAMSAQVSHFGLVAGMSWVPVQLLSVLRLSQDRPAASRLGWTAVLATATGLVILAGEPRAIDDSCVIVLIYAAWQVCRLGRRAGAAAVSVTAGLVLGACLGAIQWLPGLVAISTSQRDVNSMQLFNSGSLPVRWLLLTLVPDLLGGSGSLGQPSFMTNYNLTEVTSYVGILPLVAAFALLGRLRVRPRLPDWFVWHVTALVGIVLAFGGNTPLGDLLYRLPLFGDQRLQSRNILVLDLALAVLLGYWADQPFGEQEKAPRARAGRLFRRLAPGTVLGLVPPLAAVLVVALAFTWGAGLLHWLGVSIGQSASVIGDLEPWLIPYAVLGLAAGVLVIVGRRLGPKLRSRLITGFVVVDLVVFTVLCVVEVGPGLFAGSASSSGSSSSSSSGSSSSSSSGSSSSGSGTSSASSHSSTSSGPAAGQSASATALLRPVAALGYPGRFAIYDPDLLDPGGLSDLDPPDVNAIGGHAMPSVQGYSSIVDGRYASVTGSHGTSGDGQDTLAPGAIGNGVLDQLDTTVLLTLSEYLTTRVGGDGPAAGPPGTGQRDISADQSATWYLGTPLDVNKVEVPDPDARQDAAAGTQIGLMTSDGRVHWYRARALTSSTLAVTLPKPVASIAVMGQAQGAPCPLGPPSIVVAGGSVYVADGQLQGALVPSHWIFAGFDGSFAVFANPSAQGPLHIEALPGRSASGAWVSVSRGAPADPTVATVYSPHGARVVRSVAAIPGWTATWQPRQGPETTLAVQRDGLVQAIDVPPGLGTVTWSYSSPWFPAGLILSLAATVLVLLFFLAANWARRPATRHTLPVIGGGGDGAG